MYTAAASSDGAGLPIPAVGVVAATRGPEQRGGDEREGERHDRTQSEYELGSRNVEHPPRSRPELHIRR